MGATFTQRAPSRRRQRPFPTNRPSNLRALSTFAQNMSVFLTVWQEGAIARLPQEKKARAGQVTGAGPAQRPPLRRSSSVDWWSKGTDCTTSTPNRSSHMSGAFDSLTPLTFFSTLSVTSSTHLRSPSASSFAASSAVRSLILST